MHPDHQRKKQRHTNSGLPWSMSHGLHVQHERLMHLSENKIVQVLC
ncbi:hypothetical protein ECEC1846_2640 [Escherichia coli EC1846]|nr:hypothetical protein ECDEC3B_2744 [Escherichia coli DEC3B]EHU78005.1 hypothetical protein ECDEC3E_2831 [Escherichia coli DEC3E]EHV22504.1 hypothetical protein ECDEC4F_2598 [Escherichia coli DEC4F]EIN24380.1 hypothetical protein ECFRIK1996_2772 [Escherichia coli FRIK1996]EIN57411.1 hypothetical protein ECPA3_2666 [Escherichia coli PA3]EIO74821.1 hypothetical protein ECTW09109_2936 [Escherichia coli TW09109]EKH18310.1 hypothetical protein ECFDA507_2861 [Escherichia coli FDA507]EKH31828.1 hy